jgi:hypothetical protein
MKRRLQSWLEDRFVALAYTRTWRDFFRVLLGRV